MSRPRLNNKGKDTSYTFDQGFYIKLRVMDLLCEKMDQSGIFTNASVIRRNEVDFTIDLQYEQSVDEPNMESFHYKFTIRSINELEYAHKLYNLYVNQVKPYVEKYKSTIDALCADFDRFFVHIESQDDVKMGKSVHSTRYTDALTVHHPLEKQLFRVPLRYAHLSHFRDVYQLQRNPPPMSILLVHFDFNYFNCYFRPIFKMLANIENDETDD
jgi:hypothetical protein